MSDDTDDDNFPPGIARSRRKISKRILSSDSSSNENSPVLRPRTSRSHRQFLDESDDDNSDDSFRRLTTKRKKVALITSDSEGDSDSSGSVFIFKKMRRVANIPESESEDDIPGNSTHWETDCSDDEKNKYNTQKEISKDENSSDSDNSTGGSSDICPICLLSLKKQENGIPESCEHKFCLPCILEWSKNVNTCPVDRKEYNMLYVKDKSSETILRKIPIKKPEPPAEPTDTICCEICGSGEREDRLLLCDGCDLGFHLECLTPALDEVPSGAWYCNVCRSDENNGRFVVRFGTSMELDLLNFYAAVAARWREPRSIPRTGQSERVISRILNRRFNVSEQPTTSSSRERAPPRRRIIRGRRRTRRPTRYRTVYEVDDVTGDIISTKKQVRVKGKKRKTKKKKIAKTAKGRLAQQIGMCSTQLPNQNTPTMRIPTYNPESLSNLRHQAGIPTLHLFGQRDELDYFSEEEVVGGPDYLVRRRANHNDVAAFRRAARSKGVTLPSVTVNTSPPDLLGSIMDSQSQLFSRNAMFSVDDSGKFKVEKKNTPDLKNSEGFTRKTPYNRGNDRRLNQSYSNAPYQSGTSYYPYDSYGPSSTSESYRALPSNSQNNGGGGYDQDMPQDYTQSTLSGYDRDVDSENSQKNEQGEDSDIDIYSDIEESVSTSKIEEDVAMKPLNLAPAVALPPVVNNNSDVDNNDSENEMVIDTEKVETPTQDEEEEVKEETAVSSSEDSVAKSNAATTSEPPVDLHSTSEPVQSSFSRGREEDDDDDEDGCPNFNIYSTESINLAKNTDITLNPDENNQVVSSTPLPEPPKPPPGLTGDFMDDVYDPEFAYDPEAAYNSEKDSEEVYDPERIYDTPEDTCEPEKLADIPAPPEEVELANIPTPEIEKPEADKPEEDVEKEELEEIPLPIPQEAKPRNPNALYSDSEDEEVVKISSNSFIVGDISTMTEDVSEEERSYTPCLDEKAKGMEDLGTEMISDDEKNDFDESHEHKTASEGDALEINAKESEIDMIRPEDYEEGEIVDKNKSKGDKQAEKENQEPSKTDTESTKTNKKDDKKNEPKETFKKISKSNKERNYRDKERAGSQGKEDKSKNKEKRKRKEIERYDVRALIADKPRRLKDKFGRDIRKSSSRSRSRSYTPKISPERRTPPQRRSSGSRERKRKKRSRSRRRSSQSKSLSRERRRSLSRSRRRRSRSHSKRKKKSKDRSKRRKRDRSTSRTYTPVRKRRKEWDDRYSRERAYSAEARWTPSLSRSPERRISPSWTPPRTMESQAVDPRGLTVILQNDQNKKKKDKRKKTGKKTKEGDKRNKRRRKDQTPPPSKEVFASGDNILVSVSFNKENERRERDVYTKKKKEAEREEKKKRSLRRKKKNQELSSIKPVAIIDLDRSPFRELTPSPKDIIVLSDEDHVDNNVPDAQDVCDSSQQVASPENVPVYMTGPKTPPEPQVKFSIPTKQPVLRPQVNNPLRDPEEDMMVDEREQEEEMRDMNDSYKGPNTPPEPPNSPPSSPDAYDPFEPTKSRSPSPDRMMEVVTVEEEDKRSAIADVSLEKNATAASLTPPAADIQPADSQSSLMVSRDSSKSPDQGARTTQPPPMTSTPLTVANVQRINILSSTILGNVSSTIPQRIAVSPVKISPVKNVVKAAPIVKATPGKPTVQSKSKKQSGAAGDSNEVVSMDFESPYSPGSSDYEDLFEPPPEVVTKKTLNRTAPAAVMKESISSSKSKGGSTFDSLFDGPINKLKKVMDKSKAKKSRGTKIVGVKLDEDHLKILDELPNSAVEMQVKDKFLKKLNRQERVVEEVKLVLKPYYNKKKIDKEEYKDIMRRAVPKICHNKSGEINPTRIKNLVEAYVRKIRHAKPKVTSSSSYNPLKSLG